jgi:NADH-quinone oxidoreductase subunit C
MSKSTQEIFEYLNSAFPQAGLQFESLALGDPWISVPASVWKVLAKFLRDDHELRFDSMMCLSGIHYPDENQLAITCHLNASEKGYKLAVKVKVPEDNPIIASVESIWKTADWHEREAFDMFGIQFEGHPDMRRILCPDDWIGFPLRKDYVPQDSYMGITTKFSDSENAHD